MSLCHVTGNPCKCSLLKMFHTNSELSDHIIVHGIPELGTERFHGTCSRHVFDHRSISPSVGIAANFQDLHVFCPKKSVWQRLPVWTRQPFLGSMRHCQGCDKAGFDDALSTSKNGSKTRLFRLFLQISPWISNEDLHLTDVSASWAMFHGFFHPTIPQGPPSGSAPLSWEGSTKKAPALEAFLMARIIRWTKAWT